jgi:hypothetical protein
MKNYLSPFHIFLLAYTLSCTAQEQTRFVPIQDQMNNQNTLGANRIRRQYGQSISPLNLVNDLINNQNLPARHCVTPDETMPLINIVTSRRGVVTPENIETPGRIRRQFALPIHTQGQPTALLVELPGILRVIPQISNSTARPRRLEFN